MSASSSRTAVPVGRYAPSPTGALHLGNLRTALAAYLWTRSRGGRFLVRIEDLDRERRVDGMEQRHLADLAMLGLTWDEEPLWQSRRGDVYTPILEQLRDAGRAYPCFCSRKDIRLAGSAPHREDGIPAYPGTCRILAAARVAERIGGGERHSWRFALADESMSFDDDFHGAVAFDAESMGGDFVIRRADGHFAYQLACAVDDSLGVTEVIRGDDLLDSAARQVALLRALGMREPRYAHLPLMTDDEGRRLSKRAGDADLQAFQAQGFEAAAVRSYLAWTLGQIERGQRVAMDDLIARFDRARIPRETARFRVEDLRAFA